jgi:signal transduction histidine kinase
MINMFLASAVGFGGGITNFLPQILNIYPFGNFLVLLYLFFMSYGVLKYKFISKKIVSAQLLVGAIVLVFFFNFLQMLQTGSTATQESIWIGLLLLVLVSIFGVLVVRGVYREVAQREKIELLAKNLESANKAQAETMNFITHQIRGVFADTKAGLAALLDGDFGVVSDQMRNIVDKMFQTQNRGVSEVETFLKATHVENGTVEYVMKPFDFKQLVLQLSDQEKPRAESKKLHYEMHISDGDYMLDGDQTYLDQVVSNLIDNAIRYTPAGSIEIALVRKDDRVIFSVKDSGVGVNEEDGKKLFTKYGHGKDSRRINTDSNGLGLFIVKGIVDGHHGKIWYQSAGTGKGTTFFVELPIEQK